MILFASAPESNSRFVDRAGSPAPDAAGRVEIHGFDPAGRIGIAAAPLSRSAPLTSTPEDTERLGDEIARLAAHLHAATFRLLVLIREFDEREGWAEGFRSCAAWLSWRTGIGTGPAREKVRVARALGPLPRISEAMARGELSYSKVRALTRVATAENEEELLETARHATAAHIERLVRAWRRVDRMEEAEEERVRHRSRYLRMHPDEDGSYVLRGRLDPEVGALLEKGLEWAREALYRRDSGKGDGAGHPMRERDMGSLPENPFGPGPGSAEPVEETTTPPQRLADALGFLVEWAMGVHDPVSEVSTVTEEKSVARGRAERFQVVLHVDAATLEEGSEEGEAVLEGSEVRVSAETSRRLACDAGVVEMSHDQAGSVLNVGRKRRTVPPAIRRALEHRDRGCRFPGCACRYTDAHHIVHWADGGETSLTNLVLLCRRHHRAVHEEGFRVEAVADHKAGSRGGEMSPTLGPFGDPGPGPGSHRENGSPGCNRIGSGGGSGGTVRFFRPDGRLIPAVPEPPPPLLDPVGALVKIHRMQGVEPDPWTATPVWHGEALDCSLALDMLRGPAAQARRAMGDRGRGSVWRPDVSGERGRTTSASSG